MKNIEQLVERNIREHEVRIHHIDTLLARANEVGADKLGPELDELKQEYANLTEEARQRSIREWAEKSGPMVMWDIVAQRLENLVERIKH